MKSIFKRAFLETHYEQLNFHERQHKQADCGTIDCIVRKLLLRPALQLIFFTDSPSMLNQPDP